MLMENILNQLKIEGVSCSLVGQVDTLDDEKTNTDLIFSDNDGEVVLEISGGHIKTKNFNSSNIVPTQYIEKIIHNPKCDIRKSELRILDIGNSFSGVATGNYGDGDDYLEEMINAAGIDVSNIAYCKLNMSGGSYKDWYDTYHDLNTKTYNFSTTFGTLSIVTPTGSAENGEKFRNTLTVNKWDIIIIHQKSLYSNDFESWLTDEESGYLKEYIKILKTLQPQAELATYIVHSAPRDNANTDERWNEIAISAQKMAKMYDIDKIIPYGTAVQNVRNSSANPTHSTLTSDSVHVNKGIGQYAAAACTFESIIAPRYGISIYGNTFRTSEEATSYIIPVTNNNAKIVQMCAIDAVNDMYNLEHVDSTSDL